MQISEVVDFTKLLEDKQYKVINTAMRHEKLKWTDVLVAIYPQFKDTAFMSTLIQQYKNRSVMWSSTTSKQTREEILQPKHDKVAAGLTKISIDLCNQMQAFINLLPPGFVTSYGHTNNKGEQNDNSYLNVNEIASNSEKSSNETQNLLTLHRQEQWINATISKVFDNPAKVLHTMLNWFNARVTEAELHAIKQFHNLYEPEDLVRESSNFCLTKHITLTRGDKSP